MSGQAVTPSCCPNTSLSYQSQTPSEQFRTPQSVQEVGHIQGQLMELEDQGLLQSTPSRIRLEKLEKATELVMAEKIILESEIKDLTLANSAKKVREGLQKTQVTKGRVMSMAEVHKIRQEEALREEKRQNKAFHSRTDQGAHLASSAFHSSEEASRTAEQLSMSSWEDFVHVFQM